MTGSSGYCARTWRKSATPSSPEVASRRKFMSWMTRSTASRASRSSPPAAESAPSTRAPCIDNRTSRAVRTASLSSITSTVRSPKLPWSPWSCLSFIDLDAAFAGTVARPPTVYAFPLDGAARHGRRDRRRAAGRLQGGGEADQPDREHAADQVVEVEPRQLVLDRDPVADAERGAAAGDDACRRHHPVLDQEVPHDVHAARADRAARADLADARRDVEGREAEDAERSDCE